MKPIATIPALASLALAACASLFGPSSPFAFDKKGDLIEFDYGWSAEASRQPALVRYLRKDLDRAFAATSAAAQADRAAAVAAGRPFRGHRYSRRWATAGQSSRLLSLDGRLLVSTGADPITRADGLLWDRSMRAPIDVEQVFVTGSAAASLLRGPACGALRRDLVRHERATATASCAPPGELAIVPADANGNHRFDHFRLVTPSPSRPAGDYALARLPVSAATLAALKPAFRSSFEVGQPQ